MSGREQVYEPSTRPSASSAPTCCGSSGRTSSRWSRRSATRTSGGRLRGRRRHRHARRPGQGAGHRRHGRHRRPRHVPAGRATGVRVMATGRGHHRHQALRPRGRDRALRHPARADPRLLRPEGRHLGQHPGRPGHRRQDRLAAAPASTATSRGSFASIDKISGAKRKENLTDHADDARSRRSSPPPSATCRSSRRRRVRRRSSPTARSCARSSALRAARPAAAARGGARRPRTRRRGRARRDGRRGQRPRRRARPSWRRWPAEPAAVGRPAAERRCAGPAASGGEVLVGEAETLAACCGVGRPAADGARLEADRAGAASPSLTRRPRRSTRSAAARARHDRRPPT